MCNTPLIDVRAGSEFLKGHDPAAANIPLEELASRVHEMPPSRQALRIVDVDLQRARAAETFFSARGTPVRIEAFDPLRQTAMGQSRVRLWQPSPFLVEALNEIQLLRPLGGLSAIDVACGTGRDAAYMALRGLNVTAIDVLPDAISRARDLAGRAGVSVAAIRHDLENGNSLPDVAPAEVVTVFRYLHRPLFPALARAVAPGGFLVYETFHRRNRETGRRPHSPDHLLETGELAAAFPDFEILVFRDVWEREGRYFSSLLARRPADVR
jgi:SAM-dependent methyltransferase